ncbi:metalloregulator ArsR/SmtB family transcription factor [Candidatus Bipolaricaulota bacterium]|nr:metalloregulator ArsR/SmtB family transcription factor [Candidatus Bipolaricaulota bacterium]
MAETEELLQSLSNETRLRLLNLLLTSEEEPCVCELEDALQLPEYTVSRHLNRLKRIGLVDSRKDGVWSYYSLSYDAGSGAQAILETIGEVLDGETFREDEKRLRERIYRRENGKCVTGHPDDEGDE